MTNKIRELLKLYELAPTDVPHVKAVKHLAISRNAYIILNSALRRPAGSSTCLISFWDKIH